MLGVGNGRRHYVAYFVGEDAGEFDRAFRTGLVDTRNSTENMSKVKVPLLHVG
jgi:hypothetical protein